jgi:hypothetical protein
MAKFLDGPGVQASFTDLIKSTERELFIISPYLKISQMTKNYLASIDRRNIPISIIYRSDAKINDEDMVFFRELNNLKLYYCDNLHTKCYMNESMGIISTMNLHEHSQTHNWEMGIRFSRKDDPELYSDVTKELKVMGPHLKKQVLSQTVSEPMGTYPAIKMQMPVQRTIHKPTEAPNKGLLTKIIETATGSSAYCIRCGENLSKFDMNRPYCEKHYASWARYKNPRYKEKHCHGCGRIPAKETISFEKPLCKNCFKEYYKK